MIWSIAIEDDDTSNKVSGLNSLWLNQTELVMAMTIGTMARSEKCPRMAMGKDDTDRRIEASIAPATPHPMKTSVSGLNFRLLSALPTVAPKWTGRTARLTRRRLLK